MPAGSATATPTVAAGAPYDALHNRLFTDPCCSARYPDRLAGLTRRTVRDGDLATIAAPIDLLGVNYYNPERRPGRRRRRVRRCRSSW